MSSKCEYCGTEFDPEIYPYGCPNCHFGKGKSSQYQLLLPSIMGKTAIYMKEKYYRIPEATHVHDLTRCSTKREMEERFPELAQTVLLKPPVQIGEMIHTFIESLPTIDRAQQIFERRANDYLVVGKPDITTEEAVYCLKYRERLYREPRVHDVLEAGIYAWLARKPYGHIIYINPREFKEWVYLPTTTENVLYLIEHPMSPRWGWECRLCPFKNVCPLRIIRSSSNPQELEEIRIPELEKPENARWLALLIDTEGNSLGWSKRTIETDRINGYRYTYVYRTPYISVRMDEKESKETVDQGAKIIGIKPFTAIDKRTGKPVRGFVTMGGRARQAMHHTKPYHAKFKRMATLCQTLFKHRVLIPIEKYDMAIAKLFGRYLRSEEANPILLEMTENEFEAFMSRAEHLTNLYLR